METDKIKEWDQFYLNKNAFGDSYKELKAFLEDIKEKKNLLDLGSGQGRNALMADALGFEVTAVDLSKVGIDQTVATSNNRVKGIVADIFDYNIDQNYQVILLDAVIHCQFEDLDNESLLFDRIEKSLVNYGYVLLITHQWNMREQHLKSLFKKDYPNLEYQFNHHIAHRYLPPHETEEHVMEMSMMCFQKKKS
ncbi:class I SAM-dependent methyltransferase [Flammeovirga yaeyamensis]|uniref:Class I SAM-dependent methyltransferase n=1 Tax=Flammeovirga yaeyamensis TaxID=367791 RepID=A0AAX1N1C6_9BACT|nr:class I SAM-dependent methyltransferase [Flammeovirga yaeyamensis]MBB3698475.1 SAM-dependent methyltransferase [Flammeovirga yaeyamensis]NMF34176.1 class I SAM-dependent methyltransferase [Flammeovirga yaeyamensis]QWG01161.1 class I SAM-dependent methyltransferase [Flammeovirga yaeyamensis]